MTGGQRLRRRRLSRLGGGRRQPPVRRPPRRPRLDPRRRLRPRELRREGLHLEPEQVPLARGAESLRSRSPRREIVWVSSRLRVDSPGADDVSRRRRRPIRRRRRDATGLNPREGVITRAAAAARAAAGPAARRRSRRGVRLDSRVRQPKPLFARPSRLLRPEIQRQVLLFGQTRALLDRHRPGRHHRCGVGGTAHCAVRHPPVPAALPEPTIRRETSGKH